MPVLAGSLAGGSGLEAVSLMLVAAGLLFLALHERLVAVADG